MSNAADTLADESLALEGAGAVNILLKEQAFLGSGILDCGSALSAVSAEISSLTDIQSSPNLTVVSSASPTLRGPAVDNLSMLAPFGGYVSSFLDTALHEDAKGSESLLGVSYSRNETHYAHLPLRIGDMVGYCDRALSEIEGAVSSTVTPNCTASVVSPLIAAAASTTAMKATASGFRFTVDATIVGVAPCAVEVTVIVSQANVPGPEGAFTVELQREGLVDFEP